MSKSIRFLTDKGFLKLVEEIKNKFQFFQTNRYYYKTEYLGIVDNSTDIVFINYSEKKITLSVLAYCVYFKNNDKIKELETKGFEQALTRKTLFKKLDNIVTIIKEYYDA